MNIPEQRFRQLCRSESGGFESVKFRDALDKEPGDPISVIFEVGFRETKTVMVSRAMAEQYAKWAAEEAAPEKELLESIKPEMRDWILQNRKKMCERLLKAMAGYNPEHGLVVQIIWPTATPDVVPYEAAVKYVGKYSN